MKFNYKTDELYKRPNDYPRMQDVYQTYIGRSDDVLGVFWTSYVRLI